MDREAAAPFRAVRREGGQYGGAAGSDGSSGSGHIPVTSVRVEQEVEDRTVVPHVEGPYVLQLRHVPDDPFDLAGPLPEAFLRHLEARL